MGFGRYLASVAVEPRDRAAALDLRAQCFRAGRPDEEPLDAICDHVVVRRGADGPVVAACRLLRLTRREELGRSYAARFHDLSPLANLPMPMIEMGRFCVAPSADGPDPARALWGLVAALVLREGVTTLFGCTSFPGTDPERYADALALLHARHLGPVGRRTASRAPLAFPLSDWALSAYDEARALRQMPALLRAYLAMGGWVGSHAVIDRDLGTIHVLTALDVARIPPQRARRLRSLAGGDG
ncbi:GNAT family N-acetyltransferase [Albidovulum inexpectatum]|nr:GNAT family N-acetyltransferase [Albidovulum inexpectatum]